MFIKIKCPACQVEGSMSMVDPSYVGPYRCWSCRALFTIELKNNELVSCKPLSEEELKKLQEAKDLQNKYKQEL
ncbi:MAG: hypothetical protein PHO26_09875 [Dehalococcoidia bacterium]|nr:hypothetical protein [Dehalococcoidia bacterium]MDD5494172.1 hypothetical protein [Dehalococcoidia bacterium]